MEKGFAVRTTEPGSVNQNHSDNNEKTALPANRPLKFRLSITPENASIYVDDTFIGTGKEINKLHGPLMVDSHSRTITIITPARKKILNLSDFKENEVHTLHINLE